MDPADFAPTNATRPDGKFARPRPRPRPPPRPRKPRPAVGARFGRGLGFGFSDATDFVSSTGLFRRGAAFGTNYEMN